MIFVKLDESNIEKYIEYLEHALAVEPEQMHVDKIEKELRIPFLEKQPLFWQWKTLKFLGA